MDQATFTFLMGLGAFFGFFVLISFIFYCLMAVGLMTMAKRREIDNPWLAWIPIAQMYLLGQLIETIEFGDKKIDNAPMILLLGNAIVFVLGFIPVIGTLLGLAFLIIVAAALYKLYAMYRPDSAMIYLVLSIIFPSIAIGTIFFMLRNCDPVPKE